MDYVDITAQMLCKDILECIGAPTSRQEIKGTGFLSEFGTAHPTFVFGDKIFVSEFSPRLKELCELAEIGWKQRKPVGVKWKMDTNIVDKLRSIPDAHLSPGMLNIAHMVAAAGYKEAEAAGSIVNHYVSLLIPDEKKKAAVAVGHVVAQVKKMNAMTKKSCDSGANVSGGSVKDVLNGSLSEEEELKFFSAFNVQMLL